MVTGFGFLFLTTYSSYFVVFLQITSTKIQTKENRKNSEGDPVCFCFFLLPYYSDWMLVLY